VRGKVGVAKFVQGSAVFVSTMIHLKVFKAEEYQSMFIRIYDYAGIFFYNLNENMYIELEFSVFG